MLKGVIFDFNGTLFWDTALHNQAWDVFLEKYDIVLTDREKQLKLHGKNNAQLIGELFPVRFSPAEVMNLAREKELLYQGLVEDQGLQLTEGVVQLLEGLSALGIPFTIVTASDRINVDFFFRYLGLERWFDREKVVFSDGKIRPKPHPDMFQRAMELLGVTAAECIIFEDSDTGLQAASRSGAGRIIIVNSTGTDYSGWPFQQICSFQGVDAGKLINGIG